MDLQLTGLKAVVTGGSAGIGAAIVRVLAAEGCHVAFCARNAARIDAMLRSVEGLPGAVTASVLDVADRDRFAEWLATPEEVARVVAFVSSPAAGFVAGANWYVDGGSVSHVQI